MKSNLHLIHHHVTILQRQVWLCVIIVTLHTFIFIEFAYTRYHYVNCSVYPYYNELCACRLQRTDHGPETEHFLID
jgi:hypothetical protein